MFTNKRCLKTQQQPVTTTVTPNGVDDDSYSYQLVDIQSAYDPDAKKSEVTYFDNGFKNLANLARKEIIRLPVTFNHTDNLRGILVKDPR